MNLHLLVTVPQTVLLTFDLWTNTTVLRNLHLLCYSSSDCFIDLWPQDQYNSPKEFASTGYSSSDCFIDLWPQDQYNSPKEFAFALLQFLRLFYWPLTSGPIQQSLGICICSVTVPHTVLLTFDLRTNTTVLRNLHLLCYSSSECFIDLWPQDQYNSPKEFASALLQFLRMFYWPLASGPIQQS